MFVPWLVPAIIGGVALVALLVFMLSGYVKASPDEALIISGLHAKPRVLTGRSGFKIPFFERVDYLCLKQISVDIKTDQFIPTNDFINVKVDAVAKVRVTEDPDGMLLAERNFLNMKEAEIAASLQDSLQGNMREIIGTLTLKSINTDRDSFSDQVMAKASKDMEKLGIEILSCNIQNVTDEHGLITDLGMDNTEQIRKDASIAKARARKEVAIAEAEAEREANEVRVQADREIAEKQQALAIQRAQLKTEQDTEQAKADAAYEIQKQEQQKTVLEAETRAKAESVHVREQELAAEVKKRAEADKYQQIQIAEAQMEAEKRRAEAEVYAAEQEARATKLRGEAEAEAIRAKGIAEAEAIRAKGEAEAAALEKRAEALQKMNQAGMAEMMIKVLPEVAAAVAQPLSSISNVSVYDAGASDGQAMSRISGVTPVVIRQVFDTMSDATGVDMREVMRASTYDASVNRNISIEGDLTTSSDKESEKA